jgi:hypothetical protein
VYHQHQRRKRVKLPECATRGTHHESLPDLAARDRIANDDDLEGVEPRPGRGLELKVERLVLARVQGRDDDRLDDHLLRLNVDDHRPEAEGPVLPSPSGARFPSARALEEGRGSTGAHLWPVRRVSEHGRLLAQPIELGLLLGVRLVVLVLGIRLVRHLADADLARPGRAAVGRARDESAERVELDLEDDLDDRLRRDDLLADDCAARGGGVS